MTSSYNLEDIGIRDEPIAHLCCATHVAEQAEGRIGQFPIVSLRRDLVKAEITAESTG